MRFSYNWIKTYFTEPIPKPEELAKILTMHSFEVESVEEVGKDFVLNIDVLPNRAHDCFSHAGVAREISLMTGAKTKELFHPCVLPQSRKLATRIQDPVATPRIAGLFVENVTVKESPEWIKNFLSALGLRPINNIVDATNLVMFHSGQPLHAYDADKLVEKNGKFVLSARSAKKGEKLATLDNKERDIPEGAFIITDDNRDEPLTIAGIKGGQESGISETTKRIVVEAANFNPQKIRETSRALKLRTDASDRFEKEISCELAERGLEEFASLLPEISPGAVIDGLADDYPAPEKARRIILPKKHISQKLGVEVSDERMVKILEGLAMKVEERVSEYVVIPPPERLDINLKEDLVEEIGRVYGYENIPSIALEKTSAKPETEKTDFYINQIRDELVKEGYSEVMTYSFVNEGEEELENPMASDKKFLRSSILPKLEEAYELNVKNKELLGLKEVKIFEIGKIFKDEKEILALAKMPDKTEINLDEYIAKQPETTELQTSDVCNSLKMTNQKFQPFSPYPFITRDIALWVPEKTKPEEIETIVKENSGELLVRLSLFDEFKKEGRVSYAFRLVFQSIERTLTDNEVNDIINKISSELGKNPDFQIR